MASDFRDVASSTLIGREIIKPLYRRESKLISSLFISEYEKKCSVLELFEVLIEVLIVVCLHTMILSGKSFTMVTAG